MDEARPPIHAYDVTGNMVFVGNGYVMNKGGADPYAGLDVKGKIVVVAGAPSDPTLAAQFAAAAGGGRGAAPRQDTTPLQPCTDYLTPEQAAAKNGAIAVVTIANYQQLAAMANPNAGFGGRGGGGGRGPALNGPAYQVAKFALPPACPSRSGNYRWNDHDQRNFCRRKNDRASKYFTAPDQTRNWMASR